MMGFLDAKIMQVSLDLQAVTIIRKNTTNMNQKMVYVHKSFN